MKKNQIVTYFSAFLNHAYFFMPNLIFTSQEIAKSPALANLQLLVQRFCHKGDFLSPNQFPEWLACYDCDAQNLYGMPPLALFRPYNAATIAPFVRACSDYSLPLTPRCGGTGLVGGALASQGGIVLLTGHLRKILSYDAKTGEVCIEPGVTPRQLGRAFSMDGWHLPLEMETSGVAGIAGCLSTNARPYSVGRGFVLVESIISVTIIDGKGREIELPAALICGSEGMLGIITRLKIQLQPENAKKVIFAIFANWDTILSKLQIMRAYVALISLEYHQEFGFIICLQGEFWRVEVALAAIQKLFAGCISENFQLPNRYQKIPVGNASFAFESSLPLSMLNGAIERLQQLSSSFGLGCCFSAQLLDGRLQVIVFSAQERRQFAKQVDAFCIAWVNALYGLGGSIASAHGVGAYFRPYLPAFLNEGDMAILQQLKHIFDENTLLSSANFFPIPGRCVEKERVNRVGNE